MSFTFENALKTTVMQYMWWKKNELLNERTSKTCQKWILSIFPDTMCLHNMIKCNQITHFIEKTERRTILKI